MGARDEPVLRREDPRFLTGRGTFISGLHHPALTGAAHCAFVRSTEPHGRITSIDTSEAVSMPGVIAVFTGAHSGTELWPLMPRLQFMNQKMYRPMLATDTVRFVGEPLAIVVAETAYLAADAAEAVVAHYESLPAVVSLDDALASTVVLHDAAGTNVSWEWSTPAFEDDPFEACDVIVEFSLRHPRLNPGPMEPRAGAVAWYDNGRCISWVTSQRPAGAKHIIESSLGLAPGTVRVIAPDVGGGFGSKSGFGCYPEDVVLAWASRRIGRPLRWTESRTEAMVAMGHGRASTHRIRLGGTGDGKVLAYSVDAFQDSGAYPAMGTFTVSNLRNSGTGVYDIPAARVSGTSLVTNTTPTVAFRGAGRPEAACDIERAMDRFALALGIDPVDVRLRNVVAPDRFPYRTAVGSTYDSGEYARAINKVVESSRYRALRSEQATRRARGDRTQIGVGMACTTEITGGGEELAECRVNDDGTVDVIVGTSPHGQGHETTFAEIVMNELGIHRDRIRILHSDTDLAPFGGGTIGSRSAQLGGSSAYGAARAAVEAARQVAADLLEANEADIEFDKAHGTFAVVGTPARSLAWADLGAIEASHRFESPGTFAFGACIAVIELDTETGCVRVREMHTVDDAGTILNHQIAEGQVHGGLGLAVGAALYEEMHYGNDGVPRTANFADYALVSSCEMPLFHTDGTETPSPYNPLGVKGIGESGTVVGTPALQSAVMDALSVLGVQHLDMPYTPLRVWEALQQAS